MTSACAAVVVQDRQGFPHPRRIHPASIRLLTMGLRSELRLHRIHPPHTISMHPTAATRLPTPPRPVMANSPIRLTPKEQLPLTMGSRWRVQGGAGGAWAPTRALRRRPRHSRHPSLPVQLRTGNLNSTPASTVLALVPTPFPFPPPTASQQRRWEVHLKVVVGKEGEMKIEPMQGPIPVYLEGDQRAKAPRPAPVPRIPREAAMVLGLGAAM